MTAAKVTGTETVTDGQGKRDSDRWIGKEGQ